MDILRNYSIADLEVLRSRLSAMILSSLRGLGHLHDKEQKEHCRTQSDAYRQSVHKIEHELNKRTLAVHSELQKGGVEA